MKRVRDRARLGWWVVLVAPVFVVSGCSRLVRFRTEVKLPAGVKASAEQLHVEADFVKMRDGKLTLSPPKTLPETKPQKLKPIDDGFRFILSASGNTGEVAMWMRVWVDVNGNGKRDKGDAEGTLSPEPFVGRDRGVCAGNLNDTPPIHLTVVP